MSGRASGGMKPDGDVAATRSSSTTTTTGRTLGQDVAQGPTASSAAAAQSGPFQQSKLTLRFPAPVERSFTNNRSDMIHVATSRIGIILNLSLLPIVADVAVEMQKGEYKGANNPVMIFVLLFISVIMAVAPRFGIVQRRVSFFTMEVLLMIMMCLLAANQLGTNPLLLKVLSGQELDAQEAQTVPYIICKSALVLDGTVTAAHLMLPVRWHIMVWTDMVFAISFASFCLIIGDPAMYDVQLNLTVFSALVCGASAGLRSLENKERMLFATVIDERKLRVMAEFNKELEKAPAQVETDGDRKSSHSAPSHSAPSCHSAAMTTASMELFQDMANVNEKAWFDQLKSLGVKEQWLINQEDLDIHYDKVLGTGGCGMVVAGKYRSCPVAIKTRKDVGGGPASEEQQTAVTATVLNELRIMRHLRHPHIAFFLGACVGKRNGDVLLVLEKVEGIPLTVYVSKMQAWKSQSPDMMKQVKVLTGVAQALIYLHSQDPCIVHGDLKPDNVLIERRDAGPFPKLLDFGLSRSVTCHARLIGGTPAYMAPEIVLDPDKRPNAAADVFALGRLIFFVSSGRRPFAAYKSQALLEHLRKGSMPTLAWAPSTSLMLKLRPCVESCTADEPRDRPSAQEVLLVVERLQVARAAGAGGGSHMPMQLPKRGSGPRLRVETSIQAPIQEDSREEREEVLDPSGRVSLEAPELSAEAGKKGIEYGEEGEDSTSLTAGDGHRRAISL
mmetsp:Transcript_19315/g.42644  ORF Transcript_19315/g.42644 Transcript_19315/m.42644 type:complete len:729 (-) Transcript_19315:88-2274(-)